MNTYKIQLAEDLINTYDTFLDEPEHLRSPVDLQRFLQEHGLAGEVDETTLDGVRKLRTQLRDAWIGENVSVIADILNPLLAAAPITPQLETSDQDEVACQIVYRVKPGVSLIDRLRFETAYGISSALQAYGLDRMRACEAEPCRDVFIDTSRNGSRRFCSERCANRYNVQAFRARKQK